MTKSKRKYQVPGRNDNLTSHDRITLLEAKRRMGGSDAQKKRGGMTKSRYRRLLKRGHELFDWMRPKND